MKSLAYLVAFILACIAIGGPLALGITFIKVRRFKGAITKAIIAVFLGTISVLLGLVLILNSGGIGSKALGFLGVATGAPAILRSIRSVRDFR